MAYKIWKNLDQVERYANKRYRTWDQRWISNREQHLVADLFRRHKLGGTIIDVPSGFGRFHDLLREFGIVYAADLNHFAVEYYNQRICSDPPAVEASADNLPFPDGNFDSVFCFRLLQHIHGSNERIAILTELARVSRKAVVASIYLKTWFHSSHRKLVKMPSKITMMIGRAHV